MPVKPHADERLELLFRHAGLSEKQAKLYRILLADGQQRASALSRKSGINRSNAYALLKDLKIRGLVIQLDIGKINYFRAEPPWKLNGIIETREKDLALAKELASDMIPKLTSQWKTSLNRPLVRHFEGEKGLWDVFYDIYAPDNPDIYGCVDMEVVHGIFPDHIIRELIPKRVKHKTFAYGLLADSQQARITASRDKDQLRNTMLFDKTKYPLPAEVEIYKDKVALMSFTRGEFVALIIENKDFAVSLRSIFKFIFDHHYPDEAVSAPVLPSAATDKMK